jgi:hypothetical protein
VSYYLETPSRLPSILPLRARYIGRVSLGIVRWCDRHLEAPSQVGLTVPIELLGQSTLINNQRAGGNFNSYQPSDGDVALLQRLQMSGHLQAAAIFSNFESNLVGRIAESATYCPGISIMPSLCLGRTPCR